MATQFEAAITKAVDDGVVAGTAVVAVDKTGAKIYAKAFGNRSFGDATKPMALDSVAWLASCTKISTAVAAMQSVERGLLSLDDPISKVLPEWSDPDILTGFDENEKPILKKATKEITLKQLLTHSAGMAYAGMNPTISRYYKAFGKDPTSRSGTIKEDFTYPLLFEPGEGWEYSSGIDWAGQAVERVNGGIRLGEYLKKNIFEPLGIKHTTFRPHEDTEIEKRLLGHTFRGPDGKVLADAPDVFANKQAADDYGGGGLFGSAEDYIKILRSLLLDDGVLLKPDSVKELFRPQLEDTKYIQLVMDDPPAAAFLAPSYGAGIKWNYALGGAVAVEGLEGRLERGAMQWAGMPNSYWWIDRERGVAGVYIAELYPPADPETQKLFAQFQKDVYALAAKT